MKVLPYTHLHIIKFSGHCFHIRVFNFYLLSIFGSTNLTLLSQFECGKFLNSGEKDNHGFSVIIEKEIKIWYYI